VTSVHHTQVIRGVAAAAVGLGFALTLSACGGDSESTPADGGVGTGTTAAATAPATEETTQPAAYPAVTPGPAARGPRNTADIAFAEATVVHHGQAVQMTGIILDKNGGAQVRALAEQVRAAQMAEIGTLLGWMKGWGQTLPAPYGTTTGTPDAGAATGTPRTPQRTTGTPGAEATTRAPGAGATTGTPDAGATTGTPRTPQRTTGSAVHGGLLSEAQLQQLRSATGVQADKIFLSLMVVHHQGAIDLARAEIAKGANPQAKELAQTIINTQTAEITAMKGMLKALG
jgi:uncharacterized protein (DUF305 family)